MLSLATAGCIAYVLGHCDSIQCEGNTQHNGTSEVVTNSQKVLYMARTAHSSHETTHHLSAAICSVRGLGNSPSDFLVRYGPLYPTHKQPPQKTTKTIEALSCLNFVPHYYEKAGRYKERKKRSSLDEVQGEV